jgi:group I intron endonuclease
MIGIYKITCVNNNKVYIGSSSNIKTRWSRHKSNLKNNRSNPNLQNSYNKYGLNSLKFELIEECNVENLIEREQFHASNYKNNGVTLFNVGEFIDNPTRGIKLSKEQINNLKGKQAGEKNPSYGKIWVHKNDEVKYIKKEEFYLYEKDGYKKGLSKSHRLNISKKQKETGRKMSDENKEILREINKKPKTKEHKIKLSKIRTSLFGVKILCEETNQIFNSYTEDANKFNTSYQAIRQSIINSGTCCNHTFKKI